MRTIDFTGSSNRWLVVTGAVLGIALILFLIVGLHLGIDFTGGTIMEIDFGREIGVSQVREEMVDFGLEGSLIQMSGERTAIIRSEPLETERINAVYEGLRERYEGLDVLRTEMVGPTIGAELRRNALYALFIASILIVLYISIRFEFKFAVAALVALVHDVLLVVGVFALIQWQVNSPFIAALLTILGYSLNDTIVIFDRIRENMKLYGRKEGFSQVANRSLNDTLVRSINTSMTTTLVLLSLLIFGGATIRSFILALLLGVLAGTYSSIFVASSVLVYWNRREARQKGLQPQEG